MPNECTSTNRCMLFTCLMLCFQSEATLMDKPSSDPNSSKDAHNIPEWANLPLKSDGKLDTERLMPTTFQVCSKEYCKGRQDLSKRLPILTPKRERLETKTLPIISNLTLLELYDLSGEEIIEFRTSVLETLGESDRINNMERLMSDQASIRKTMMELRRVANEIHEKKSRDASTAFLNKPANLAILGYFTRRDPLNKPVGVYSPRLVGYSFKEFLSGNKGSARVSVYNWRHKKWNASVTRNLAIHQPHTVGHTHRIHPSLIDKTASPAEKQDHPFHSDNVDPCSKTIDSPPTVSPSKPSTSATSSISKAEKLLVEEEKGENIVKEKREEVNFFRAVKANKVSPHEFGLPKGFVKTYKIDRWKRKMASKKKEETEKVEKNEGVGKKKRRKNDEKYSKKMYMKKDEESASHRKSDQIEVMMDDIEEEDEEDEEFAIDVCDGALTVTTSHSSCQTDDTEKIMRTESGDTVVSREIAAQLEMFDAIHTEDMETIQKLIVENALAVKNLSKYHNKYLSLMIERNSLKSHYNSIEKERKSLKTQNVHLSRNVREVNQHNTLLTNEVRELKRELAMRDRLDRLGYSTSSARIS